MLWCLLRARLWDVAVQKRRPAQETGTSAFSGKLWHMRYYLLCYFSALKSYDWQRRGNSRRANQKIAVDLAGATGLKLRPDLLKNSTRGKRSDLEVTC